MVAIRAGQDISGEVVGRKKCGGEDVVKASAVAVANMGKGKVVCASALKGSIKKGSKRPG